MTVRHEQRPPAAAARSPLAGYGIELTKSSNPFRAPSVKGLAVAGVILLVALGLPYYANVVVIGFCIEVAIYAIATLGLTVSYGIGGELSMAQASLVGLSAYIAANLAMRAGWAFPIVAICAIVAASAGGLLVTTFVGRARGHYLVLVTFGFAQIATVVGDQLTNYTGGANGLELVRSISIFGYVLGPTSVLGWFYACMILLVLSMCVVSLIRRSKFGGLLRAVRENELAAARIGINVRLMRYAGGATSGAFAGLAGLIWAYYLHYLSPGEFEGTQLGIGLVIILLIGGAESIYGPVIGACVYLVGPTAIGLSPYLNQIILGIIFVVVILVMPHGIAGTLGRLRIVRTERGGDS